MQMYNNYCIVLLQIFVYNKIYTGFFFQDLNTLAIAQIDMNV
jgi:hypothetical protein